MDNGMTAVLGVFAGMYLIFLLALLAWGIAAIIANVKLFEKAGVEGWKAIIPFYSTIKMSEIATGKKTLGILWTALYAVAMVFYWGMIGVNMTRISSSFGGSSAVLLLLYWLFILGAAVVSCILLFKLAKAFGKSDLWCVLMIFLSAILIIAMGFDKDLKYIGPNGVPSDQYVPDNYNNNNNYYNNY